MLMHYVYLTVIHENDQDAFAILSSKVLKFTNYILSNVFIVIPAANEKNCCDDERCHGLKTQPNEATTNQTAIEVCSV